MNLRTSVHIIIKEHLNYAALMIPGVIECVEDFADEIIVADNGCTPNVRSELEKALESFKSRTNKKYVLFNDNGTDFSAIRNASLEKTDPQTDYILHVDADEFYYPDQLLQLRQTLAEHKERGQSLGGIIRVYHTWIMIEPTLWQQGYEMKPNIYKYTKNLRWEKPVHEYLTGLEPGVTDTNVTYIHMGYTKPQHERFIIWMHYELLERGNFNAYREYYDPNANDGQGGIVDYFRDWREPATILEDRRPICKPIDPETFPEPLKRRIITPWKSSGLSWNDWLKKIDPESFAFYEEWKEVRRHTGSWKRTFEWLRKRMGWPEEKL